MRVCYVYLGSVFGSNGISEVRYVMVVVSEV